MIFPSAFDAYQWAQETLSRFRNGTAFDPDPDRFRGGRGIMGLSVLVAIDIDHLAKKACRNGHPCPHYTGACFMDWYIPDPVIRPPQRGRTQMERIECCVREFEGLLEARGYIE